MPHAADSAPTQADLNRHVADAIRAEMARQGIRNRDLAKLIGQSDTWVSRRLSPQVDYAIPLDLHDVAVIADALRLHPGDLFCGAPA